MSPSNRMDIAIPSANASELSSQVDEEIDLRELFKSLWRKKLFIAMVTLIITTATFGATFIVEKRYEAVIVFAAVSDDPTGGRASALGSLGNQFGGLMSIAGVSLSGNERKAELLAILQSQALTQRFIRENGLLPVLFRSKWDSAKRVWKTMDPHKIPTLWSGNRYFAAQIRRVTTDSKTGISTMTISWSDPKASAFWANGLVALANEYVRSKTIHEADQNVSYLNEQLLKANVVAVQNSISALLENEIKRTMLARGSEEYAFRVIDPAVVPEKISYPNRVVWTVLAFFAGAIVSIFMVLVRRS